MTSDEKLLSRDERRTTLFPIRCADVWDHYQRAKACFWVPGEVDLSADVNDWKKLTDNERFFLSRVLAFFASADGIVNDNLCDRFGREVQLREAKFFYDFQKTIENVHSEMYSLLIDTLVEDPVQKDTLFHAVEHIPCVQKKAEWAEKWIHSDTASFAERLIAFAVVEGVFFSGSFCAIFWVKKRGLLPGLCHSNALIARDEGMHQQFATFLYREYLTHKLDESRIQEIVRDAVDHEVAFCTDALPVKLIGMNCQDMTQYIRFVADRLLTELNVSKLYHVTNPFDWMDLLCLENKTNFFEHRVAEYQKVGAIASREAFSTDADF